MLALAVRHGPDVDASYLEGLMVMDARRELGAFRPEDAVHLEDIGFARIPGPMGRSKKRSEWVELTEDGRLYLRRSRAPAR